MTKFHLAATASLLCLNIGFSAFGAGTQGKPIMSADMPTVVADLPSFGSIAWTVKHLPFVGPGPKAGISGMGFVAYGRKIYVMGGFIVGRDGTSDPSSATSRWTHCYDPATNEWTKLSDMPGRREYGRAVVAGKYIYFAGGGSTNRSASYLPFADVFRLDLSSREPAWEQAGQLSVPRTHAAADKVAHFIVVAGGNNYMSSEQGYSPKTIQGVTDVLDLSKPEAGWKQKASIPGLPRGWTASASVADKLYVFGGLTWTKEGLRRMRESLCYDPTSNRWTPRRSAPIGISGWKGDAYKERYVVLVGGVSSEGQWNDLPFVYDVLKDRWMKVDGRLPPGAVFNDPGVSIIGDTIYVAGAEGPGGSHFDYLLVGTLKAAQGTDTRN